MKLNKKFYGLMAGIMALALASPLVINMAKADSLDDGIVAKYSFDNESLQNLGGDNQATAIVTGLSNYSGTVAYTTGRSGSDKAIKTGDYGLKLNEENLGENYTVSLWMKPDGNTVANGAVLFLGDSNPERWYGIAGSNGSTGYKVWCHDNEESKSYRWKQLTTFSMTAGNWYHIVMTGDKETHTTYIDGTAVTTISDFPTVLSGDGQDILLGVNNWDAEFVGAIDDVLVYNRTLSASEVLELNSIQNLQAEGLSVTDVKTAVGRETNLVTSLSSEVTKMAKISYEVADENVATVKDGLVKGIAAGDTTVTVCVDLEGVASAEATAKIHVAASMDEYLKANLSLDGDSSNAILKKSGLDKYTAEASYVNYGVSGEAIDLNGYGLDLGITDIGEEFTVSFFVRPDAAQVENQIMLALGYHNPELWTAISGKNGSSTYKLWGNGGGLSWTTLAEPVIATGEWSQVTLVGVGSELTCYVNGSKVASASNFNKALSGESQGILFGVNYWDTCFDGQFDEIKIYNIALSDEEIAAYYSDNETAMAKASFAAIVNEDTIKGNNESLDSVKYSLSLPTEVAGETVSWSSSNTDLIADDGTVLSTPDEDTEVTLTASLTIFDVDIRSEITVVVKAIDYSQLNVLITQAESIDATFLTETSYARLTSALTEAKAASTFETVDAAVVKLTKAIKGIEFTDAYVDPFDVIPEATDEITIKKGETATVFTLPDAISSAVTVSYTSENEQVLSFDGGQIKAKAAGKAIVTATVTALSDGYSMEYSTAVEVKESSTASTIISTVTSTLKTVWNYVKDTISSIFGRNHGQTTSSAATSDSVVSNNARVHNQHRAQGDSEQNITDESSPDSADLKITADENTNDSPTAITEGETPAAAENISSANTGVIVAIIVVVLALLAAVAYHLYRRKNKNI